MRKFQPRILGKNKKKQGGFTLIELVIVIIIAGILGAAIVATYVDLTTEAEEANVEQTVAAINTGISTYIATNSGTHAAGENVADLHGNLLTAGLVGPVPNGATLVTNTLTVNGVGYVLVPRWFNAGGQCTSTTATGEGICYVNTPTP